MPWCLVAMPRWDILRWVRRRASLWPRICRRWRRGCGLTCDQRNLRVASGTQNLQHVHQLAIRHTAVREQENAAIVVGLTGCIERTDKIEPFDRGLADRNRQIGLYRYVERLIRLLLRARSRRRQINRQVDSRQWRRHHEDDQQNQHDVDEWRDVDLVGFWKFVVVIDTVEIRAIEAFAYRSSHGITPLCVQERRHNCDRGRATADGRPRRTSGRRGPDKISSSAPGGCR